MWQLPSGHALIPSTGAEGCALRGASGPYRCRLIDEVQYVDFESSGTYRPGHVVKLPAHADNNLEEGNRE